MKKTSYLDYYKMVLERVSFDDHLLAKEYSKAKRLLPPSEQQLLDAWLDQKGLTCKLEVNVRAFNQV